MWKFKTLITKTSVIVVVVICFSHLSDSFVTPWTVAHHTPLSMRFPRQEYWRILKLPFASPGDLPNLGIETGSPALQVNSLPLSHQGSYVQYTHVCNYKGIPCDVWTYSTCTWKPTKSTSKSPRLPAKQKLLTWTIILTGINTWDYQVLDVVQELK